MTFAKLGVMPVDEQILRFLAEHPDAQDTLEGIAEWWVLEQRIKATVSEVKAGLDKLLAANQVTAHQGPDGRLHYRANPAKLVEAKSTTNSLR